MSSSPSEARAPPDGEQQQRARSPPRTAAASSTPAAAPSPASAPAASQGQPTKLIEDIKSLEGLFDLVLRDSEDRLKFKSSEMQMLRDEMTRWRDEAVAARRQAEADALLASERAAAQEMLAAQLESQRRDYEIQLHRAQADLETALRERDAWKTECERMEREGKKLDVAQKSLLEKLKTENRMLKSRLESKSSEVSSSRTTALEQNQTLAAEVLKWKEEFYKNRVFGEQQRAVMQEKIGQLASEVKMWKEKLYEQKLAYETELRKRGRMLDSALVQQNQAAAEGAPSPSPSPSPRSPAATLASPPGTSLRKAASTNNARQQHQQHQQRGPMPDPASPSAFSTASFSSPHAVGSGPAPGPATIDRLNALGTTLAERTLVLDTLIARVMRLQDDVTEDRRRTHPVVSSLQTALRGLSERIRVVEVEFRTDVGPAFAKLSRAEMDVARWRKRLLQQCSPDICLDFETVGTQTDRVSLSAGENNWIEISDDAISARLSAVTVRVRRESEGVLRDAALEHEGYEARLSQELEQLIRAANSRSLASLAMESNVSISKIDDLLQEVNQWKAMALLAVPAFEMLRLSSSSQQPPPQFGRIAFPEAFLAAERILSTVPLAAAGPAPASPLPPPPPPPPLATATITTTAAAAAAATTSSALYPSAHVLSPSAALMPRKTGSPPSSAEGVPVIPVNLSFPSAGSQTLPIASPSGPFVAAANSALFNINISSNSNSSSMTGSNNLALLHSPHSTVAEVVFGVQGPGHVDGYARRAAFNLPWDVCCSAGGSSNKLYVIEHGNRGCIRKVNLVEALVVTVLNNTSSSSKITLPRSIACNATETHVYVTDSKRNSLIRVDIRSGAALPIVSLPAIKGRHSVIHDVISCLSDHHESAGGGGSGEISSGGMTSSASGSLSSLDDDRASTLYVTHARGLVCLHTRSRTVSDVAGGSHVGFADGELATALFNNPGGMAWLLSSHYDLLVADTDNHVIRLVDLRQRRVSTFAGTAGVSGRGDGPCLSAKFHRPSKLAMDAGRGLLFVSEAGDHIRVIDVHSRTVGTLSQVVLNSPQGICWVPQRQCLAVVDSYNHALRLLSL